MKIRSYHCRMRLFDAILYNRERTRLLAFGTGATAKPGERDESSEA